jgi:hypothetical protein
MKQETLASRIEVGAIQSVRSGDTDAELLRIRGWAHRMIGQWCRNNMAIINYRRDCDRDCRGPCTLTGAEYGFNQGLV